MARNSKTEDPSTIEANERPQEDPAAPDAAIRTPRPGSKLAIVMDLLESEAGATIAEIMTATGWQCHTVRGALSGMVTKKLGRAVVSDRIEGRGRVYRIASLTA